MAKPTALLLGPILIAACTSSSGDAPPTGGTGDPPTSEGSGDPPPSSQIPLDIRHTGGTVEGTDYRCTGAWPSEWTPCGYAWTSQPAVFPSSPTANTVELSFIRSPIPVDGGASVVHVNLTFDAAGALTTATAQAITTMAGPATVRDVSDAVSGWIDPVELGASKDQRNAGRFALTFAWGSITGTYDTDASSP